MKCALVSQSCLAAPMNSRENGKSNALAVAMDKNARGMNPFSARASCCIHFTWGCLDRLSDLPPLLDALEKVLRPFNPRPHYGKLVFSAFESQMLVASLPVGSLDESVDCCVSPKHDILTFFICPDLPHLPPRTTQQVGDALACTHVHTHCALFCLLCL